VKYQRHALLVPDGLSHLNEAGEHQQSSATEHLPPHKRRPGTPVLAKPILDVHAGLTTIGNMQKNVGRASLSLQHLAAGKD
jgi:hypothetical protein